jgi:hypothetical protein
VDIIGMYRLQKGDDYFLQRLTQSLDKALDATDRPAEPDGLVRLRAWEIAAKPWASSESREGQQPQPLPAWVRGATIIMCKPRWIYFENLKNLSPP